MCIEQYFQKLHKRTLARTHLLSVQARKTFRLRWFAINLFMKKMSSFNSFNYRSFSYVFALLLYLNLIILGRLQSIFESTPLHLKEALICLWAFTSFFMVVPLCHLKDALQHRVSSFLQTKSIWLYSREFLTGNRKREFPYTGIPRFQNVSSRELTTSLYSKNALF